MRFSGIENKAGASSRTPKVSEAALRSEAARGNLAARARHAVPLRKEASGATRNEASRKIQDNRGEST